MENRPESAFQVQLSAASLGNYWHAKTYPRNLRLDEPCAALRAGPQEVTGHLYLSLREAGVVLFCFHFPRLATIVPIDYRLHTHRAAR